jgi:HEPN domain-containing protein
MNSIEEWHQRASEKQKLATYARDHGLYRECWGNSGMVAEFYLKAYIFKKERFNSWPSSATRPDLHTHSIRKLIELAEIDLDILYASTAACFIKACEWERRHDYEGQPFPKLQAEDMYNAVFGNGGVAQWLIANT